MLSRSGIIYLIASLLISALWGCSDPGGNTGISETLSQANVPVPENIVLISIDTLRSDHLGGWGYPDGYSATLDRMAAMGTIRQNMFTVIPHTTPGHASLLTGCYPVHHGSRDNAFPIDTDVDTLAQTMASAGYATAGSVAHFLVGGPSSGLDRGFQAYWAPDEPGLSAVKNDEGVTVHPLNANQFRSWPRVNSAVRDWLATAPEPYFLFLHYYECHKPYRPKPPWNTVPGLHPYDGEIADVDGAVADLLRMLQQKGTLDRTEVMITADHGESLGEHGYFGHGYHLYYPSMGIPWIAWSHGRQGPEIRTGIRRIMDIMPTILTERRIPVPLLIDGRSDPKTVTTAFGETSSLYPNEPQRRIRSVRTDQHTLVYRRKAEIRELYFRETDPGETVNIYREESDIAQNLTSRIDTFVSTDTDAVLQPEDHLRPEVQDALRALGYMPGS